MMHSSLTTTHLTNWTYVFGKMPFTTLFLEEEKKIENHKLIDFTFYKKLHKKKVSYWFYFTFYCTHNTNLCIDELLSLYRRHLNLIDMACPLDSWFWLLNCQEKSISYYNYVFSIPSEKIWKTSLVKSMRIIQHPVGQYLWWWQKVYKISFTYFNIFYFIFPSNKCCTFQSKLVDWRFYIFFGDS